MLSVCDQRPQKGVECSLLIERTAAAVVVLRSPPDGRGGGSAATGRFVPSCGMDTTTAPRPRTRPTRRLLSLVLVAGLAVSLIGWSNRVEVVVDGEQHRLRTYASTVGEVLDTLEVEVGPDDAVRPEPDRPVRDGLEITVDRAIVVDLVVDGAPPEPVTAPVSSVAGVLTAAGLADVRERGAELTPAWTAPVVDGDRVHVRLPTTVAVVADGGVRATRTLTSSVGAALTEAGIELGADDVVLPAPENPLVGEVVEIVIQRVAVEVVRDEVELEREEVRRETDELERGLTRLADEGADGLRIETYEVTMVDDVEVDRAIVGREIVAEPERRVIEVGTAEPEPRVVEVDTAEPAMPSTSVPVSTWDRLAECEANGNWQNVSRNGMYFGGLQFHPQTWRSHKPAHYPASPLDASREQQIFVAERVLASQGWAAWPACSRRLGLR